jgi:hypothetical protein
MNTRVWTVGVSLVIIVGAHLTGFAHGVETDRSTKDFSGLYYVTIGPEPLYTMVIGHSGASASFTISGSDLSFAGTGTVDGQTMLISADLADVGEFEAMFAFSEDGESFSGTWEIDGWSPQTGTITGSRATWREYDVDALGVPLLAKADCIALDMIQSVSKFRSGEGHDYSDDFELCRSMKHYFVPADGVAGSAVALYSPVTGTIIGTTEEWEGPESWTGTAIGIRPTGNEAFYFVIYHVDPEQPLGVGDRVTAGQLLGTGLEDSGAVADIAFGVHTPYGHRLVSFYETISMAVYARYVGRGVRSRSDFVISEDERDADPLTCNDGEFFNAGSLDNWLTLDGDPPGPRRPSRRASPVSR